MTNIQRRAHAIMKCMVLINDLSLRCTVQSILMLMFVISNQTTVEKFARRLTLFTCNYIHYAVMNNGL